MHTQMRIVLPLLLLQVARAASFYTNCTKPHEGSHYVSGPNVRSTLGILWSSLFTIFLCTWTVQHLNVPPQSKDGECIIKRWWLSFWRKLKWMLFSLVLPEFLLGKAFGDFVAALRSYRCKTMQGHARTAKVPWTITHAFYANLGGFVLEERCPESSPTSSNPRPSNNESRSRRIFVDWFKRHEGCLPSGGYDETRYANSNFEWPIAVNAAHICVLMSLGLISKFPSTSENEIKDKSKEDFVVKIFTLGQIAWLFIELAVRWANKLPTSQLEIGTFSFAVCTFITYLFWIKKPKSVEVSTKLQLDRPLNSYETGLVTWLSRYGFFVDLRLHNEEKPTKAIPTEAIPNDQFNAESNFGKKSRYGSEAIGFILGAVVFGACHCLAWNFEFPTSVERIVWRASSVFTTAILPLFYPCMDLFQKLLSKFSQRYVWQFLRAYMLTAVLLYTLCQIFLIAEMFRSLFYLPPDAFVATWPGSIPHIG